MIQEYIQKIQIHLIQTHSEVLNWFNEIDELKNYRPEDKGWTVQEILEHISLTSHFLLKLIDKGTDKALRNVKDMNLEDLISEHDFDLSRINKIGEHKSFDWIRPEHMEPTGNKSEIEVKNELINQMNRCLNQLGRLSNGEGLQHKTMMTVDDLGKINVYEYVYFLSKHAERHIDQMKENKREFDKNK